MSKIPPNVRRLRKGRSASCPARKCSGKEKGSAPSRPLCPRGSGQTGFWGPSKPPPGLDPLTLPLPHQGRKPDGLRRLCIQLVFIFLSGKKAKWSYQNPPVKANRTPKRPGENLPPPPNWPSLANH